MLRHDRARSARRCTMNHIYSPTELPLNATLSAVSGSKPLYGQIDEINRVGDGIIKTPGKRLCATVSATE